MSKFPSFSWFNSKLSNAGMWVRVLTGGMEALDRPTHWRRWRSTSPQTRGPHNNMLRWVSCSSRRKKLYLDGIFLAVTHLQLKGKLSWMFICRALLLASEPPAEEWPGSIVSSLLHHGLWDTWQHLSILLPFCVSSLPFDCDECVSGTACNKNEEIYSSSSAKWTGDYYKH